MLKNFSLLSCGYLLRFFYFCLLPFAFCLLPFFLVSCSGEAPQRVSGAPPAATPASINNKTELPNDPLTDPKATPDVVQMALKEFRTAKDNDFKTQGDSPLADEDKAAFKALNYYPIDLAFRFVCKLKPCATTDVLKMLTSKGDERSYRCFGLLEFKIKDTHYSLTVFRSVNPRSKEEADSLFVPFKDTTSGKETYGGGRYLDFHESASGVYVLDFNQAYNPYCSYSNKYSCPIPPTQNVLPIAMTAGEKNFGKHH